MPKRPLYRKKAVYLATRHEDALDDLARHLRRSNLPDDRSMIMRALIDLAAEELKSGQATTIIERLSLACRQTLPGTTKTQGD